MRHVIFYLSLALAACGRAVVPVPAAPAAACRLLERDSLADSVVVVGIHQPVDLAHAPVPLTEAERFVFGTFYETLVRRDCEGRVEPGLAERWIRVEPSGRHWQLTVRNDAMFWDGTPVTAADVVDAWADRGRLAVDSVAALDSRTLSVVLASPDTAAPGRLADPRLAVAKRAAPGGLPVGTGVYAVTASSPVRLEARAVKAGWPSLAFVLAEGADPRDLLDQGVDVFLSDDPAALAYAQSRDAFDVVPLPWAWTYVVVGGGLAPPLQAADPWGLRDAVRGDVRWAEPPYWWDGAPRCPAAGAASDYRTPGMARTVAYVNTDPVARDIAERLAAVAGGDTGRAGTGPTRALGLPPAEFDQALKANRALVFVTALPRRGFDTCLGLPAGGIIPLLDARTSLVARHGRVGIEAEWDGTPRLIWP